VRLWFLQTVKADELQESVTFAKTRTVRVAPERGRMFDADGRILADNERGGSFSSRGTRRVSSAASRVRPSISSSG
jgi:cell division protein FtsI/penicillin-binding protein 2